jgi:hypothetical protein
MGQDNYGYDQRGLDVQLTDDRSKNGATSLSGYPLDVRPASDWPGQNGSASIQIRSPDVLTEVSGWLNQRASEVQSLPQWLGQQTSVSFGPASWHEANNLKDASQAVAQAVSDFMTKVVQNMQQAAATIDAVHSTYLGTENANAQTFQSVSTTIGGPTAE